MADSTKQTYGYRGKNTKERYLKVRKTQLKRKHPWRAYAPELFANAKKIVS